MSGPVELVVEEVSKYYGLRRSSRIQALDSVSLTVGSGSAVGIVGESGSGKSTLAKMLVGLEVPTTGRVLVNGRDVRALSHDERLDFRRTVQFVAQDTTSSFDPRRTLRDSVRLPVQTLLGLGRTEGDEQVNKTLTQLGLPLDLADRKPSGVSGGQRQRFSLARAFAVRPRLLICDEVVSALDVSVQGSILNLLKRYCRDEGAGLVFVSHGLPATAFVSQRLVVMHRGRVVEDNVRAGALHQPLHPYTAQLLAAHHGRTASSDPLVTPEGGGRTDWACRYAAICQRTTEECRTVRPRLHAEGSGTVACHHPHLGPSLAGDEPTVEEAAHA